MNAYDFEAAAIFIDWVRFVLWTMRTAALLVIAQVNLFCTGVVVLQWLLTVLPNCCFFDWLSVQLMHDPVVPI